MKTQIKVAFAIAAVAIAASACGATTATNTAASPSSAAGSNDSQFLNDLTAVGSDLTTVGHDAGVASNGTDYSTVSADCSTMLSDVATLQADGTPSMFTADMGTELATAANDLSLGAHACISGSDNSDASQITAATGYFSSATTLINNITSQLG